MSARSPIISDWIRLDLDWSYINRQIFRSFSIKANSQFQLPIEGYTFGYYEIVLIEFSATFDDPSCGIRIEGHPEYDSGTDFTISNISSQGILNPDLLIYAIIPPTTLAGYYTIRVCSPWVFKEWMRIYLINTDRSAHNVLNHSYTIAVLNEERLKPREDAVQMFELLLSLYPELKDDIKLILGSNLRRWLSKKQYDLMLPRR